MVYLTNHLTLGDSRVNKIVNPDESEIYHVIELFTTSKSFVEFYLIFDDLKAGWQLFKSFFKIRKAAGGLVQNSKGDLLFIQRKGFWDLPKGHIEKGEKKRVAALREVTEECGIQDLKLDRKLLVTYHTYLLNGALVLKPNHWYLMQSGGHEKLVPQIEEGITVVKWVTKNEAPKLLENSFPSIADVLDAFTYSYSAPDS